MSIPNVKNLMDFRHTVQRSSDDFGEIRQQLNSHLADFKAKTWEIPEAIIDFETVFRGREKDILELEEDMQNLVIYLDRKIELLLAFENHDI